MIFKDNQKTDRGLTKKKQSIWHKVNNQHIVLLIKNVSSY